MDQVEIKLQKKNIRISKKKVNQNDTIDMIHNKKIEYFNELYTKILPLKIKELDELNTIKDIKLLMENLKKNINEIKQKLITLYSKEEFNYNFSNKQIDFSITYLNYLDQEIIVDNKEFLKKYPEYSKLNKLIIDYNYYKNIPQVISNLETIISDIKNKKEEIEYFHKCNKILDLYYSSGCNVSEEMIKEYYFLNDLKYNSISYKNESAIITKCKYCDIEMEMYEKKGCVVCLDCGYTVFCVLPQEFKDLGFKEQQDCSYPNKKFFYQRRLYFKECLMKLQAKQELVITDNVIKDLLEELKIKGIQINNYIDIDIIKKILKMKGHSKHYENIPFILQKITGEKYPLNIPENIERIYIYMFDVSNEIYEIIKPKNYKSTIPINYYMFKFSQILNKPEYLPFFNQAKDPKKIYDRDLIWKKIIDYINDVGIKTSHQDHVYMKEINWRFIPTV